MKDTFRKPIKLGVTGGIGSGKTTICRIFTVMGIPVFSADIVASLVMESDQELRENLNQLAGKDLYQGGALDRQELAKIIFSDREMLLRVNSLVHPVVFSHYLEWAGRQETPYSVMEAAILFESGASELVDMILTVVTPVQERIGRIVKGKKLTEEQVMERIKNQIDDESRIKRSDFVVYNSENDMVIPVILEIHEKLVKLYNSTF
jgi:dephospho-CoA kinase